VHVGKGNERTVNESRAFWAIGDILFILESDLGPRVGTAGHGYARNRTR
jgi:hypothetical protein